MSSIYQTGRNIFAVTPSGIIAIPSGSNTVAGTAISASIPQILAITCSSNFNNRLTKLTTLNAFGIITLASGSSNFNDTRIILRYIDSSSFASDEPGVFRKENPVNEDDSAIDLRFSGSKLNDTVVDIPINNNDDSFLVAYRTIEALNSSPAFNSSFKAAIVDDGSSLSSLTASIGNMTIGSGFKIRNSASLGVNNLTDGGEGKFTITSINSGSVALPDFSGTQVQVGGMMIGSSFKVGGSPDTFSFNIIQSGSGKTNQRFYPGRVSSVSASLVQRIDPDDNKSFEFLVPSQSIGGDDDLAAFYISSSRRIGFATKDPLADVDIRADEFQVQRKAERRGIKINTEGNVESFDRNTDTAATGSEFILKYSRGISITKEFVNKIFTRTFTNDSDAQTFFNALKSDIQQSGLEKGERAGFISPPQVGDTLGSIRWVSESGSIGDFNERVTGETAVVKAVVSSVAGDGVQADLIFSVADKTGAAVQKLLLDAGGEHQLTGSLFLTSRVFATLASKDNINTAVGFSGTGSDSEIVLQPNGSEMLVVKSTGTGVHINKPSNNADFRIDGNDSFNGDYGLFFDVSGDGGRGQLYLGGEFLADIAGIAPVVNAKLHVSGNIFADGANGHITASGNISASGTIFASSLNVTSITSSIVTSSIIQTEGSNIFGDAITDTQTFNGHITASGIISASGDIISNKIHTNLVAGKVDGSGIVLGSESDIHVTASGNISASGTITALSSNIITIDGGSF